MTTLATFPLNVSKFIVDTLRLPPIAKGAYLMILLDYCAKGEPPPDNANVLAQIAGVDFEDWDEEYTDLIRPLFVIHDGRWFHTEIEDELARARKVADNAARASVKAAEARTKRTPAPKPLAFEAEAAIRAEELGPRRAPAPTTQVMHIGKPPAPAPEPDLPEPEAPPDVMPIPEDFALDGTMLIQCRNSGADMDDIAGWLDYFRSYNATAGTLSDDWTAAWWRYFDKKVIEKNKAAKPAKAAPRVEVSRRAPPPPS